MARGWESKSVEEQQSQAGPSSRSSENNNSRPVTEQATNRNREAIQLACARIKQQLEACTNERYAEQLRKALADLEKQLSE